MSTAPAPPLPERELIYDWNEHSPGAHSFSRVPTFFDVTLRDGLQNPSVKDPPVDDKIMLLHLMERVGIDVVEVGLPGASKRNFDHSLQLCREIELNKMKIRASAAGRTRIDDVQPIIEISQRVGMAIDCYVFIASSPIRQFAEDWDLNGMALRAAEAITAAAKAGLRVTFVTEDATRSRPEVLAEMFKVALDHGATRLCLADTVGQATPYGVRCLVQFTRTVLANLGAREIGIDWHGHNDRGLALWNCIEALLCGADRVHATALGVGERVGNTPMELVLVNLKMLGVLGERDLGGLVEYCTQAARMIGWTIPINYPVFGSDAFRTATGVHAAAIMKAERKGHEWLADRIYSSVPASMFSRSQRIDIGYMSGASNVVHWLREHRIEPAPDLVARVLKAAKEADHIFAEAEVQAVVDRWRSER